MSSLRRYAPFALLVAAQIVLVVVAPSKGTTTSGLGGSFPGGQSPVPGASSGPGTTPPVGTVPSGGTGAPAAGGGVTPAGGGTGPAVTGTGGSVSAGDVGKRGSVPPASGSTTGKAFCVVGLAEHPPCIAQWAGGSNGGATSAGVTGSSVTVVMYRSKANAAVDTILRETGTYIAPADEKKQFLVDVNWINKHYQLYGRTIKPVYLQGTCDIAPPNDTCFRAEADRIASQYHPFALFWDGDTNEAAFMDELSRKGIINWGGWAFSDQFSVNLRPYHYDLFMGGDYQADFAGTWYCNRLAGKKAVHAGSAALRNKTRKVVVIYPDTEQTTPSAQRLMNIIKGCAGSGAVVDGKYSSNTATAAQQATTNTAKYKAAGVTTSLWFSDPIAPAYGTKAASAQNFYPENVIAGSGLLDYDALAQTYDQTQWKHAFGPSDVGATVPVEQQDAGRIWKAEGQKGKANPTAQLLTVYSLTLCEGIMAAGPKLTPLTYEYGLLTAPGYDEWSKWHDPQLVYLKWGRGDYTGVSDVREVYYVPNKRSAINNHNGAYVALNGGRRYQVNQLPHGDFRLPSDA